MVISGFLLSQIFDLLTVYLTYINVICFQSAEDSSLIDVKSVLLAGGRHLTWFELGLALGLYYGTLKVIQSEYFNDDQYLTGTLAAWLKQKDRVPKQGVPSWNSLVRALAHPLVSQQGLAWEIAMKHPKVILCMVYLNDYVQCLCGSDCRFIR